MHIKSFACRDTKEWFLMWMENLHNTKFSLQITSHRESRIITVNYFWDVPLDPNPMKTVREVFCDIGRPISLNSFVIWTAEACLKNLLYSTDLIKEIIGSINSLSFSTFLPLTKSYILSISPLSKDISFAKLTCCLQIQTGKNERWRRTFTQI